MKALEALEEIKKYSKVVANSEELNIIEKSLKALEIIKDQLDITFIETTDSNKIYYEIKFENKTKGVVGSITNWSFWQMINCYLDSKDEYALLKEVITDE